MKPLSESRLFAWLCIILLAGILVGISTAAWAGGPDIEQTVKTEVVTGDTELVGGDLIGGDNSIGGNRSYAVGLGSIDVDIAQCLGSEATGILVVQWQRLKPNPWCMADTLDAKGLHQAAAKVRCSIESYANLFDSDQQCRELSTMVSEEFRVERPVEQPSAVEDDDEHREEIDELYALVSDLQAETEKAKAEARKAQRAAEKAPEIALQQQIDLDAQRRANARAILEEKQ